MINYELVEKNKNIILNFGIIILALIIAFQFYKSTNNQVALLVQEQNNEREKNKVVQDIALLEKKSEGYKKLFVKKDLASVMDIISGIAKDTSVKILSVKPSADDLVDGDSNPSFLITLSAASYHALGNFISKIENHKDVYLVREISIKSSIVNPDTAEGKANLEATLKIYTIYYL